MASATQGTRCDTAARLLGVPDSRCIFEREPMRLTGYPEVDEPRGGRAPSEWVADQTWTAAAEAGCVALPFGVDEAAVEVVLWDLISQRPELDVYADQHLVVLEWRVGWWLTIAHGQHVE